MGDKECNTVMAVLVDKRTDAAPKVQKILTEHGCIIDARIGLHNIQGCSEDGLILLHLCGTDDDIQALEEELSTVHRVKTKKMSISFDQ
ncbi:MAG: hypothetical protein ACOCRZ_02460 [Halothermotrichaceae bacterium]